MKRILELLTESDSSLCIVRILTVSIFIAVFLTWQIACIMKGAIMDIPGGVVSILMALLGAVLGKNVIEAKFTTTKQ
jgi:hypothetical protein